MKRFGLAVAAALAILTSGCAGSWSGSASVTFSADIQVPVAEMPPKYAAWVVEAEGYLETVNRAYRMHQRATAELAAALGVDVNPDAIASFIRSAIQVETTLTCEPPRLDANFIAECTAEATARATGRGGSGGASGQASAGIQANCQANYNIDLKPGKCTWETTVTEHPILSDAARWAIVEANMKVILQIHAANRYLDGRGAGINARGMELHVQSVTDLAEDPTLALQLENIRAELQKGAEAARAANQLQGQMNRDLGQMAGAINAQFPSLSSAVNPGS